MFGCEAIPEEGVCYLLGAGPLYDYTIQKRPQDLLIAADGGYTHARKMNLEADILCTSPDERYFCFVEVKSRRIDPGDPTIRPADAVDARKRTHMLAFARAYMAAHPEAFAAYFPRLDVVEVYLGDCGGTLSVQTVRHYPGAVRPTRNYQKHRND